MGDRQAAIELTGDGALVLSHWLEKLRMTGLGRVAGGPALRAPVHRTAGTLDKALPELFAPDRDQRFGTARRRLRPQDRLIGLNSSPAGAGCS